MNKTTTTKSKTPPQPEPQPTADTISPWAQAEAKRPEVRLQIANLERGWAMREMKAYLNSAIENARRLAEWLEERKQQIDEAESDRDKSKYFEWAINDLENHTRNLCFTSAHVHAREFMVASAKVALLEDILRQEEKGE